MISTKQKTKPLSTIAIAAVIVLFASGSLAATQAQAFPFGGFGFHHGFFGHNFGFGHRFFGGGFGFPGFGFGGFGCCVNSGSSNK
jgi:hypothetical protein